MRVHSGERNVVSGGAYDFSRTSRNAVPLQLIMGEEMTEKKESVMKRTGKTIALALGLAVTLVFSMVQVEAKMIPRVTNFVILLDQSGSMFEKRFGQKEVKSTLAKDILVAMNEKIPELGYWGAIQLFAPDRTLIGPETYNRSFFANSLENIPAKGKVYGNLTPLGPAILHLDKIMNRFSGKTAVIVVSDGRANKGMDPLKAAKTISAEYTNICFDIVSLADNDKGEKTLKEISGISNCSYAKGGDLLSDPKALDRFIEAVFYVDVPDEVPLQEFVLAESAELAMPEVITLRGIHFDFDKYEIKPEWTSVLDESVKKLTESPNAPVIIGGHTDWTGPEAYNQTLSERRAKAVYDYFIGKGVAPERMEAAGYGETMPEVSNLTREGRAINRRVVIQMVE